MTDEEKRFALKIMESTRNHDDWLIAIRYGWNHIRSDTSFLMQLMVDESKRMSEQVNNTGHQADHLEGICKELKVKFVVEPTVNTR